MEGEKEKGFPIFKVIAVSIVAIVLIAAGISSIAVIPAGHRGVLLTWGKVEGTILSEGISTVTPFMNQVVPMTVQTQVYKASASAASKDLQIVSTEVTLNYRLNEGQVNKVYQTLGVHYEDTVIQPAIQEVVKASTARYTAEELITKREVVKQDIENGLNERMGKFGGMIMTQTLSITNFDFSPEFNKAIESKVTAEQLALKAENDLKRIKVEAQQKVAEAEGQAIATLTKAKAEAEAIKITGEALRQNQQLVQLEAVKKWNGIMPITLISGGETPTLLLPVVGGTGI